MPFPSPSRSVAQVAGWFAACAAFAFAGQVLGYAACLAIGTAPPQRAAWAAFAVVAAALACGGTALLMAWDRGNAARPQPLELTLAAKTEQMRKLRHDIRGALSPVLLVADRLLNHADPAVKRSGEIMVRTVDRATALLAEASDAEPSPPDDP